jgi:acyl-CoA synthetase (AMP-forming)/AMP-acid ligase II
VALILHTSGTTNRPKAVPLTHANLAASVRNIQRTYAFAPDDVGLLVMPLFHVHGLMAGLLAPLYAGGCVVVQAPRFSASHFWRDCLLHRCSWYTAVPTMHQILLSGLHKAGDVARAKLQADLAAQGRLRFVRSCSSALAPATLRELQELLRVPVVEAYAMTEASHQMTSNTLLVQKPGSVGVGHGVGVSIRDDAGNEVAAGIEGEICAHGPNITAGYLNNPTANAESFFPGGWLRTGDRGVKDADGFVFIVGRLKEMINRGGEKIMPGEIDTALLEHAAVAEAVAFGAPDQLFGQVVHAAVVLKAGPPASAAAAAVLTKELQAFAKTKLAAFKVPVVFHFATAVPRTPTGKIQRRFVAEHFLKPQAKL